MYDTAKIGDFYSVDAHGSPGFINYKHWKK